MSDNHYVFVIHGTWNPPDSTSPRWHQLDETDPRNFCRQVNDHLERYGLGRIVWRSSNGHPTSFSWSGANEHRERLVAGEQLSKTWEELQRRDPFCRIHVIAHSHGCNVTLKAIEHYQTFLRSEAVEIARLVVSQGPAAPWNFDVVIMNALQHKYGENAGRILEERRALFETLQRTLVLPDPITDHQMALFMETLSRTAMKADDPIETMRRARLMGRLSQGEFVEAWAQSSTSNRIGRLVFLGGPFMKKRWANRHALSPYAIGARLIDWVGGLTIGAVVVYAIVCSGWFLSWLVGYIASAVDLWSNPIASVAANPFNWPLLLSLPGFFIAALLGLAISSGSSKRDLNPYFDVRPRKVFAPVRESAIPYKTLVVNAGPLDEVILGFSSEPLIFSALLPLVRSVTRPRLAFRLPKAPIGRDPKFSSQLWRFSLAASRFIQALVLLPLRPVVRMWERVLVEKIVQLISIPSMGFGSEEFDDAKLTVENTIGIPDFFAEETFDASASLASHPQFDSEAEGKRYARYEFLWNKEELQKRRDSSWLWPKMLQSRQELDHLHRRYFSGAQFTMDKLLPTCLALEERLKEVAGSVQLTHSAYYSDAAVIDMIAAFIAHGSLFARYLRLTPLESEALDASFKGMTLTDQQTTTLEAYFKRAEVHTNALLEQTRRTTNN